MSYLRLFVVPTVLVVVAACTAAFIPSAGMIGDFKEVNFSSVPGMKRGEACATTYLGLFTEGDALLTSAAKAAGINKIEVVEYRATANILFNRQCLIAYGR